jgi:hypothetical protein
MENFEIRRLDDGANEEQMIYKINQMIDEINLTNLRLEMLSDIVMRYLNENSK